MAYFQLQPAELELQELAEQYWQEAGERERQLEAAAYEAGEAIRTGEHTLPNLETIVRWKSERMVHYLIGNSSENIRTALAVAASPTPRRRSRQRARRPARRGHLHRLRDPLRHLPRSLRGARLSRPRGPRPRPSRRPLLHRVQRHPQPSRRVRASSSRRAVFPPPPPSMPLSALSGSGRAPMPRSWRSQLDLSNSMRATSGKVKSPS